MNNLSLTVGSDPEFFFVREGIPFPVCGMLGGNKARPRATPFGGIQEDNVMCEITHPEVDVYAPDGERRLVKVLNDNLRYANTIATNTGMGLDRIRSSYEFKQEILDYFGQQARTFGCEPDFNAYTGLKNPKPTSASNLRTCGGHVHLGSPILSSLKYPEKCQFVMVVDEESGKYCIQNDPDLTRMSRYGQAGAFRPKPYGIEYRVPSNFWLQSDDLMYGMIHSLKSAYEKWLDGYRVADPEALRAKINRLGGVTDDN